MNSVDNFFKGVDATLSGKVEYFKPFTYAVDALTKQVKPEGAKRAIQVLTYATHILDTVVQGVAAVALALYKTGKGVVQSYRAVNSVGTFAFATAHLLVSPVICATRLYTDLAQIALWGVYNVLPIRTIMDIAYPTRSLARIATFNDEFKPLSYVGLSPKQVGKVEEHLEKSYVVKVLKDIHACKYEVQSMSRAELFSKTLYNADKTNDNSDDYYVHQFGVFCGRTMAIKPLQFMAV